MSLCKQHKCVIYKLYRDSHFENKEKKLSIFILLFIQTFLDKNVGLVYLNLKFTFKVQVKNYDNTTSLSQCIHTHQLS